MAVDHRPYLERNAARTVRAMWLGLAGCALLGAGGGAWVAVWLTTPRDVTVCAAPGRR